MNRTFAVSLVLGFAACGTTVASAPDAVDDLSDVAECPGLPIGLPGTSTTFTLNPPAAAVCGLEFSGAAALPGGGWILSGLAGQDVGKRATLIEVNRQGQPGRSWMGGPEPSTFVANPVVLDDGSVAVLAQGGTPNGSWLARIDLGTGSGATVRWSLDEPGIAGWSLLLSSVGELWALFTANQASTPPEPGILRRYATFDGLPQGSLPLDPPPSGLGLLQDLNGNAVYSPNETQAFDVRAVDLLGAEQWRHTEGGAANVADLARGEAGEIWAVGAIGAGAVEYRAWKVTRFAPEGHVSWTGEGMPQGCHQIPIDSNPGIFFSASFVVPAPDGGALVGISGEADREPVRRTVRFGSSGTLLWQVATVPIAFARLPAGDHAILFEQTHEPDSCAATGRIFEVPFNTP